MASLFNMPTPDQVRQQARQGLFKQAAQIAQAPAGRGFVQQAAQAGGLFGEAIGRAAGGKLPGEEQAEKFQAIQQQVQEEFGEGSFDSPNDFAKMATRTGELLIKGGFIDQGTAALNQGLKAKAAEEEAESQITSRKARTEAEERQAERAGTSPEAKVILDAFGVRKIEDLPAEQRALIIALSQAKGAGKNKEGTAIVPSALERERQKVVDFTEGTKFKINDTEFSADEITNKDAYDSWIADRAKEIQAEAKRQKKVVGFQRAVSKAKREADKSFEVVSGTLPFTEDITFIPPDALEPTDGIIDL